MWAVAVVVTHVLVDSILGMLLAFRAESGTVACGRWVEALRVGPLADPL